MKTRIQVLTDLSYDKILASIGYEKDGNVYKKDGCMYKIAWLHTNSWGQLSYIDLIEL